VAKLYRGFESTSLRHAVCTAEKFSSLCAEIREQCPYFAIIPRQTGLRRTDSSASNAVVAQAFLWRAHARSGFKVRVRRRQCDQRPGIRPQRVDFCQQLRHGVRRAYPKRLASSLTERPVPQNEQPLLFLISHQCSSSRTALRRTMALVLLRPRAIVRGQASGD